ncbi:MAG: rod shape-determining protein MreC [candidate division NC10 bacterium]|nr:rod shape-determining protein MreC [candidate division NC10 bacterium]
MSFQKRRGLFFLLIVLVLSFLLLTYEVRFSSERVSLPKRVAIGVASPFLRTAHRIITSLANFRDHYIDLRKVRRENLALQEEVNRLKWERVFLLEAKRENERLHKLLQLQENIPPSTIAARVIAKDPSNWFRSILIDKGAREGVNRNATVICPQGLVGRVIEVMERSSRVQLITDPNFAAGALIQRGRVGGILMGEVGSTCRLKFLPPEAEVQVGDPVLTSGLGGLSPKGVPIGIVAAVDKKEGALYQEAQVLPRVDLFRIEEVLILAERPRSEIQWKQE